MSRWTYQLQRTLLSAFEKKKKIGSQIGYEIILANEYEREMDSINDQSDYFAFVNEFQRGDEPTAAIKRAYDAYKTAKQNATLNRPGDFGQVSKGKESKGASETV